MIHTYIQKQPPATLSPPTHAACRHGRLVIRETKYVVKKAQRLYVRNYIQMTDITGQERNRSH